MNWLNGTPLLNVGITLVVLVGGGFLAWRGVRNLGDIKRSETLVRGQFVAVDERDVFAIRNKFVASKDRELFDQLLADVRKKTGGVVREGHLFWMLGVVSGEYPRSPVLLCEPPGAAGYNPEHDVGVPLMQRFLKAKAAGREVEAYDYLRQAAEMGSPGCMWDYGVAMMRGEIPGKTADPGGVDWLEKAAAGGFEVGTFGMLLLEGDQVPADRERGLALMRQAADGGDVESCMALGRIYSWGLYEVPRDVDQAVQCILKTASPLRRFADRHGLSQIDWARRKLIRRAEEEIRAATAAPARQDSTNA